ncbi:MAG: Hsp20/alpha crystallin family protein [Desulfuromonadales bacterium]|nr:Hsp20/alpha crystallin family protein [Desulfuromonadales bacterium]
MSDKSLANMEKPSMLSREATRRNDQYISPAVDIFESEDGLTLVADMPGLDEKSLDISIDQGVLTIKGEAPTGAGGYQYQEFAMAGYWRQFMLSDSFAAEKAEASIKQGVMTLRIPKAEAAKPKRIEVTVH